jgi:hypothetical protein
LTNAIPADNLSLVVDIQMAFISLGGDYLKTNHTWEKDVQEKVAIAAAELERGEGVDGETAIAALKARLSQNYKL